MSAIGSFAKLQSDGTEPIYLACLSSAWFFSVFFIIMLESDPILGWFSPPSLGRKEVDHCCTILTTWVRPGELEGVHECLHW